MHRILTSTAILAFLAPTTDAFTPLSMMPSSGHLATSNSWPQMRHSTKILAEGDTTTTSTSTTTSTTTTVWTPNDNVPVKEFEDPRFVPILEKQATVAAVPKLAQRWRKSTKQLATLGPASSTKEMIEKLFLAGADIFRLNFSHGSQEQKKDLLIIIREIEEKYSHPIAILGDLQGPKLRVSLFFYSHFFREDRERETNGLSILVVFHSKFILDYLLNNPLSLDHSPPLPQKTLSFSAAALERLENSQIQMEKCWSKVRSFVWI